MSRSSRKSPIKGFTVAESEKADKQANHQRERAHVRIAIARTKLDGTDIEQVDFQSVDRRQVSNPAKMAKDGKQYLQHPDRKQMQK